MAHTDLAQQTLVEQNTLMLLIEGMRNTLSWKFQGTDFARKLSTLRFITQSFQRHLERVLALEEYDGYMNLVLQASPHLSNNVHALRQDHDQFRKQASKFVHHFDHISPTDGDSFARICCELVVSLNRLDAHNKKEAKAMQEAFNQE